MKALSPKKAKVMAYMDQMAPRRERYIRRNAYYYRDLLLFLKRNVPPGRDVLEVGCGTGHLLHGLEPRVGVGIDLSRAMLSQARRQYPRLRFHQRDVENLALKRRFDYVVVSDTLGYLEDIQKAFRALRRVVHRDTRLIITYHNFLWTPILSVAEWFNLKMPRIRLNWLNQGDIENLLRLEGFAVVKKGRRLLLPKFIPVVSWLANKILAHLPLCNRLTLTGYLIARPLVPGGSPRKYSASVVIPARNEKGNIEKAVQRIPALGRSTEIIFVEGHSRDGTLEEIRRVCRRHARRRELRYYVQKGIGKADAVRTGFEHARGDILLILDADLTVPPEELPKFFAALAGGRGEFINGTRLVYPLEKRPCAP